MNDETYSADETIRRREAALKRMLATPHKPHAKSKKIVSRAKSATAKSKKPTDLPKRRR
jgi:hypothetical protein